MSSNVKLIYVNNVGPLLGVIQEDVTDAIVVKNPCQFGLDESGEFVIRDYLEGISNPTENVIFMKYGVVSVSVPDASIAKAYVEAIEALEQDKPAIFVPSNKIIV